MNTPLTQHLFVSGDEQPAEILLLDETMGSESILILSSIAGHFLDATKASPQVVWVGCNPTLVRGESEANNLVRRAYEQTSSLSQVMVPLKLNAQKFSAVEFVDIPSIMNAAMLDDPQFDVSGFVGNNLIAILANVLDRSSTTVVVDDFSELVSLVGVKNAYIVLRFLKTSGAKIILRACNHDPNFVPPGGEVGAEFGVGFQNVAGTEAGSQECPWLGLGGVVSASGGAGRYDAADGHVDIIGVTRLILETADLVIHSRELSSGQSAGVSGTVNVWSAHSYDTNQMNYIAKATGVEAIKLK